MLRLSLFFLALLSSISAYAVRLPAVINSNMVLQRDMQYLSGGGVRQEKKFPFISPGKKRKQRQEKNGEWMVKLDKLKANASPSVLTVKGNNEIKLENVLVGEVWICSGQSNMEWSVARCANPKEEIAKANYSKIRLLTCPVIPFILIPRGKAKVNGKSALPKPFLDSVRLDIILAEGIHRSHGCSYRINRLKLGRYPY